MRSLFSFLVVAGLLIGSAACLQEPAEERDPAAGGPAAAAGSGPRPGEPSSGDSFATLTEMTRAMKRQAETSAGQPIVVSGRETLAAVLPGGKGWTGGKIEYRRTTFAGLEFSEMKADFRHADRTFHLRLTDTGTAAALLAPVKMVLEMNRQREDDLGYERTSMVLGVPASEKYSRSSRRAELTFLFRDRFIVHLSADGLDDGEPLREVAGRLALSALNKGQERVH